MVVGFPGSLRALARRTLSAGAVLAVCGAMLWSYLRPPPAATPQAAPPGAETGQRPPLSAPLTPTRPQHSTQDPEHQDDAIDATARAAGATDSWWAAVNEQLQEERYAVRPAPDAPLRKAYEYKVYGWQGLSAWLG